MGAKRKKVVIVGANGFIGKALCKFLVVEGFDVVGVVRREPDISISNVNYVVTGDFVKFGSWSSILRGCDYVIFAAGLAHVKGHQKNITQVIDNNTILPLKIARHARKLHIKKFLFLSTIKVLGEFTEPGQSFGELSTPNPTDLYAESKLHAEIALQGLDSDRMQISIIRLPLIIGNEAKGNVGLIQKMIKFNIPIPVANLTTNSRSIIPLDDLSVTVGKFLDSQLDLSGIHHIKHSKDLSTRELVMLVGELQQRKPILITLLPQSVLHLLLKAPMFSKIRLQLLCNLEITDDCSFGKRK